MTQLDRMKALRRKLYQNGFVLAAAQMKRVIEINEGEKE